jgi:hypothetical protein
MSIAPPITIATEGVQFILVAEIDTAEIVSVKLGGIHPVPIETIAGLL